MASLLLLKRASKDFIKFKANSAPKPLEDHIRLAIEWLCMAQDVTPDAGVSLRYSLIKGWSRSYPETTGYIIPTFLNYASFTRNDHYFQRGLRMADWELSIQNKNGSFNGGPVGSGYDSFVFDTGQIVFGLLAAYKATRMEKYLEGAVRAGDWLIEVQEQEGMWKRHTYNLIPHSYYTMVAWALAELSFSTKENKYRDAACRNIDWALTQQNQNGWFDNAGFTESTHRAPLTHTIAYTMDGILQAGLLLEKKDYIDAVARSGEYLKQIISEDQFCYGTYDRSWKSNVSYSCLTGCVQIALILLRLYEKLGHKGFLETAQRLNRFVCEKQELTGPPSIKGAISGSYPIWGGYQRFAYPNWAAKFFVDSLMLELSLSRKTF